ncbi:2Fe-2S iron-sulfur cluster-binding protein [Kaarinaea lacus]
MPQQVPLFRAARLVGVTRSTLQKRIRKEGITTFEGSIDLSDLAMLYPRANLSHDSEFERVQNIKATAYSKRIRERILPDVEVLISRVNEFARELSATRTQLTMYHSIVRQIIDRLKTIEHDIEKNNQQNIDQPGKDNSLIHTREAIQTLINHINISFAEITDNNDLESDLLAQDTILRIMAAHIRIQPSNHEYWLEGNTSLLEAGVQSGLSLNYGCTNGNCGLCKARLVNGEVKKIRNHDYVLSEAEKNMNYFLMCSNTAATDLVVEALVAKDENDIPRQEIITKVKKLDKLNDNIFELHLQTPRVQRLRFMAGQSVTLDLPDGVSLELPIASCPCDDRNLLFHIDTRQNGIGQALNDVLSRGNEVMVVGPHGDFLLDEESDHDQIFIAFDVGFAPIKSLIEHAMALDEASSMHLYRIADTNEDLYLHNLCRSWDDALENFFYHPLVGEDLMKSLTSNHKNFVDYDFYIAGNKEQSVLTQENLLGAGVPGKQVSTA